MSTSGGSSGGLDPTTASRLFMSSNGNAGLASGADKNPTWDFAQTPTVGTDLAVDGVDLSLINVLVDGVYAVLFLVAASPATFFTRVDYSVSSSGALGVSARQQSFAADTALQESVGWTFFIPAGAHIRADVSCEVDAAGTWDLAGGSTAIIVQRVA